MDELLNEFLTETNESIAVLDVELVELEQKPDSPELLANIFRLVHTIKGTCGFLGLPRLEKVAHAGENVLGKVRDGELAADQQTVTLILESLDRIKELVGILETTEAEPEGDDSDLVERLNAMADSDGGNGPGDVVDFDAIVAGEPKAGADAGETAVSPTATETDGSMAIGASEAEAFWTEFLRSLARRGLRGVKLLISDDHKGLKAAATRILGATWQRCRVHFARNLLAHAGRQGRRVVSAFVATAKEHRQKLHSTNPIERLHAEVKRRTNVVGIFPNEAAITRLVGAILLEQNDEWAVSRRYMTLESIAPLSNGVPITLPTVAA